MMNWVDASPDWAIGTATQLLWIIAAVLGGIVLLTLTLAIASAIRGELGDTCARQLGTARERRREAQTASDAALIPAAEY